MVLVLCTLSDDVLYLYCFVKIIGFQNYWANIISILKFTKGHNTVKNQG